MVKWLIKLTRDSDDEVTAREPIRVVDNLFVRDRDYIILEGVETDYPIVSEVSEDKYEVIEDLTVETALVKRISNKLKRMEFGKYLIALASDMVDQKDPALTIAQRQSIQTTYADFRAMCIDGGIADARAILDAITPDETLITTAEKTSILDEIDSNLTSLGY